MGYEPHSKRVWYRRGASGVRTTLRNMYGTGEGPLVYKPHSETCSVQEMGLCGVRKGMEDTVGTREGLPRYGTG